jgi:hypothetical protein
MGGGRKGSGGEERGILMVLITSHWANQHQLSKLAKYMKQAFMYQTACVVTMIA